MRAIRKLLLLFAGKIQGTPVPPLDETILNNDSEILFNNDNTTLTD